MGFLPPGNGTSSHVLFLWRASISSALLPSTEMLPSHALPLEELMVLLPRLEDKYATLLSIIYSECQSGAFLV
ncbi:hypothetical protein Sjap_016011 [Stephania japonica]|uniref:Uncharacterized protein n=1 Tax=Stephania japonica TaxID=461633 RepID=A0AAP0IK79_9MAGN